MPTFRQRPLTWLFAIAYACVMAATLTNRDHPGEDWGGLLVVAGLYIVGSWAGVSQGHRLARAAVLVGGVTAANLAVIRWWYGVQGDTVALISMMAVASFVTSALTRHLLALGASQAKSRAHSHWQISIVEILGWMVIVAVASTTLRFADFSSLSSSGEDLLWMHGAALGMVAGLYLTPERRCDRVAVGLATLISITALWVLPKWGGDWYVETNALAPIYAVVGLWILVLRLDDGATPATNAIGPAVTVPAFSVTAASKDQ